MSKQYLFVANWKMNLSFSQTIELATKNYDSLVSLATKTNQKIVLCPSTESTYPLAQMFRQTPISVGAQTASRHTHGSFTGQVAPQSLQEVGCNYCIIGHSETRKEHCEHNEYIAQKCMHLLDYDVTPVVCVGESEQEHKSNKTLAVLEDQLAPILDALNSKSTVHSYLTPCIAYEPVWSIGTGKVADVGHLDMVLSWLAEQLSQKNPKISWKLLYGGSVTPENVANLKRIDKIDGFLIGKASLDFQRLEKIVE